MAQEAIFGTTGHGSDLEKTAAVKPNDMARI
jgi:hypothetical protein